MMLGATSIGLLSFAVGEEETTAEEGLVLPQESLDSIENLNIKNYMHFGDSMSTGYMLGASQGEIDSFAVNVDDNFNMSFPKGNPNTTTHDWNNPYTYGSYPSLIAEAFGLDNSQWYSFAREGLTTNDVHRILDPNFYNQMDDQGKRNSDQAFGTLFGTQEQGKRELANMQALAQQMLPKADLITIGMGPNDIIFSPLFDVLFVLKDAAAGNTLYAQLVGNATKSIIMAMGGFDLMAAYSTLFSVADVIGALPEVVSAMMLSIVRGYMSVQQNWEGVVNYIRAHNQHATIVCVGGYNATRDLQFADIDMVRIGKGMGIFTTIMNLYWANTCPLRDQYLFVDIRNVDLPAWPTMVEWPGKMAAGQFFGYFMSCSHPSYKGHEQIANAILDALFQEEGTNTLPVTSLI
jgi:lysophospholipase L1-like esterase